MSVNTRPLFQSAQLTGSETTLYTSDASTYTIIDKFTAYNSDSVARTLTVRIVASGGSAGATNIVVLKSLAAGETYYFPELVGHVLAPGDFLSALASTTSVINVRASGRKVT